MANPVFPQVKRLMIPAGRTLAVLVPALVIGLAVALLSGRWLAISQQPLSRSAVAHRLLDSDQPENAAYVFTEPHWQAIALYRAGRYRRSVTAFVAEGSTMAIYNAANAYAFLGKIPEAISALEAVLAREPGHADARHNVELLRAAHRAESGGNQSADHAQGDSTTPSAGSKPGGEFAPPKKTARENTQVIRDGNPEPSDDSTAGSNQGAQESANQPPVKQRKPSNLTPKAGGGQTPDWNLKGAVALANSAPPTADKSDEAPQPTLLPPGTPSNQTQVESELSEQILLRQIVDDPALVLRARLRTAWRARKVRQR